MHEFKVFRCGEDERGWYEVMLSPFKTIEECLEYITNYSQYYPKEHQNYKIKYVE
jgi:hypothetical protein